MQGYSHENHTAKKAILHIDGDCFFASIEQAQHSHLRGKALVTGAERGIVSSMSKEAKALGVKRTMPIFELKKKFPKVIIVPGDYEVYSMYSNRMYEIVRRYTDEVEEYSIDECFADITGLRSINKCSYEEMGRKIANDLENELGVTFSIGLSSTKTLAKLGSKWNKPSGFTYIKDSERFYYLDQTPSGSIWNIGPQSESLLQKISVTTAGDFARIDQDYVNRYFHKPLRDIWCELNSIYTNALVVGERKPPMSISRTKTFFPSSNDMSFVFAELSKNCEKALLKLRSHNLLARSAYIFIKTSDFKFIGSKIKLTNTTDDNIVFIKEIENVFKYLFDQTKTYRATGVVLFDLVDLQIENLDLFGEVIRRHDRRKVFKAIDEVNKKFGKSTLFVGSSLPAINKSWKDKQDFKTPTRTHERAVTPSRRDHKLSGETDKKRIGIPLLGSTG